MYSETTFKEHLKDFLKWKAAAYQKPCRLNSKITNEFNKAYGYKKSFRTIRDRIYEILSEIHLLDATVLEKVGILYVFRHHVSNAMQQELDMYPSVRYSLSDKCTFVTFSSGNGELIIEEATGKRMRVQDDVDDEAPTPRRMRMNAADANGDGTAGEANGEQEMEDVKPNIRELAQAVQPELREVKQEEELFEDDEGYLSAPIYAFQLVNGIFALSYTVDATYWLKETMEMRNELERTQTVPVIELCRALDLVLAEINLYKKRGFETGAVRVPVFFAALQTAVLLPFGARLMKDELNKITREMNKIDQMELEAKEQGECVESWVVPKETADKCIKILLSLIQND